MENGPGNTGAVFYIGQDGRASGEQQPYEVVASAREDGYDFVTIPITNNKYHARIAALIREHDPMSSALPLVPSLDPSFTNLTPDTATASVIGLTSSWADVTSPDPVVAHVSRQVLSVEIAYAAFCGVSNVLLPDLFQGKAGLAKDCISRYTTIVSRALDAGPYLQLLLPFPIDDQVTPQLQQVDSLPQSSYLSDGSKRHDEQNLPADPLSPWDTWNQIRSICRYSSKLAVALSIPRLLPSDHVQSRWFSEPVRLMTFHTGTFPPNQRGFPVLSKAHQAMLTKFMRLQMPPWLLLSGLGSGVLSTNIAADPTPAESAQMPVQKVDRTPHLTYLRHLQMSQPPLPPLARFAQGYQDFLQSPLQPLTDNLESITYEVFEKDPIKYEWYERAIALALRDLYAKIGRPIILAVVGAGRGPLMTRSLKASASTGVPIIPYAIEKNPNAYVLLQRHNASNPIWAGQVQVIKTDMRAWGGPQDQSGNSTKVDIFVSELLGSFADNELSPECLDGAQHLMHPDHGISIPQSYTAWITPITSPRLYAELLYRPETDREKWDLSYVVMLHQFAVLSHSDEPLPPTSAGQLVFKPDVKCCWEFQHPLPPAILAQSLQRRSGGPYAAGLSGGDGWNEHNARSCRLSFPITDKGRGVCHGLAGYFETVLYASPETGEKVELSTNPNTMEEKSQDMISWFPIFFPLKTPIHVLDGSEVEVVMNRVTDDRKVWYDWQVNVWTEVNGIRQMTGGGEVQSSKENGCLM